jgi:hypothetical protein
MINFIEIYDKYCKENPVFRDGIYSDYDAKQLYAFVREFKPTSIVDCAPRTGKTTSAIIQALIKNSSEDPQDINYFIFEKDPSYFNEMKMYLLQTAYELKNKNVNMKVFYDTNIVKSRHIDKMQNIDFLFIDANHDYMLSAYIFDNVAIKVKDGGYIHIHDMYVDFNGNGLKDMKFKYSPNDHPDIVNPDSLKQFYPTIYDQYLLHNKVINIWEGDIVYDVMIKNNLKYFSTCKGTKDTKNYILGNCALYLYVEEKLNVKYRRYD